MFETPVTDTPLPEGNVGVFPSMSLHKLLLRHSAFSNRTNVLVKLVRSCRAAIACSMTIVRLEGLCEVGFCFANLGGARGRVVEISGSGVCGGLVG